MVPSVIEKLHKQLVSDVHNEASANADTRFDSKQENRCYSSYAVALDIPSAGERIHSLHRCEKVFFAFQWPA